MAIDLGTANTLIYLQGKGIVLEQPSVVSIDRESGELVAVGNDAKVMLGRTGIALHALKPLKDGVITNATATMAMLREFFSMAKTRKISMRPRILVCVPSGITEVNENIAQTSTVAGEIAVEPQVDLEDLNGVTVQAFPLPRADHFIEVVHHLTPLGSSSRR